ncbi:UDP-glucose 4-epimerase family protein [Marinobacter sp.]|uniref:UDP-glucose 4-epimerase family protein n=1 Tax=Marinobacter sp. TaxID=50741 RepID=UPI003B52FBDA
MSELTSILVTGASGFVGSYLIRELRRQGFSRAIGAVRTQKTAVGDNSVVVGGIDETTDWSSALEDMDVVIHTAARAHIINDDAPDPLSEFRKVNVAGTRSLVSQAASSGVKRFIFISSIKVIGEQSSLGNPFNAASRPMPGDGYGLSKLEAEEALWEVSSQSDMELVIIRPPLIYGLGVKGNFASMIRMVEKGIPLPLGAIHNKRSLVAVENLIDLIITCIEHPAAVNEVFLVSDGEDLSTSDLLRRVAAAMGKPSRLIPVPVSLLQFGATVLGKKTIAQRLLGSLQVDISKTRSVLGWAPPLSVDEGLLRCFIDNRDR